MRAGVPNRDAVQAVGSSQPAIVERFKNQLARVHDNALQGKGSEGILISGDFGSGKSHLLEYMQHVALENNFVCSKIVISKETPLHDRAKMYEAAIQSARVPGRTDAALVAVAESLDFTSAPYRDFVEWVNTEGNSLSSRFPATVCVFERGKGERNPEIADRILQFWSGEPLAVGELRAWLKELGEAATYKIDKANLKALALQRYLFTPRLIMAAGYSGWVILIDEVELIGRYSLMQRARSYAELARLLGKLDGFDMPGITTALSISADFDAAVLTGGRIDEERIPARLRGAADDQQLLASQAERGMRTIERDALLVDKLTPDTIRGIFEKVRSLYVKAYGWTPPEDFKLEDRTATAPIRQHIKRWITEWDLKRLYPDHQPEIQVDAMRHDYSEMPELQGQAEGVQENLEAAPEEPANRIDAREND